MHPVVGKTFYSKNKGQCHGNIRRNYGPGSDNCRVQTEKRGCLSKVLHRYRLKEGQSSFDKSVNLTGMSLLLRATTQYLILSSHTQTHTAEWMNQQNSFYYVNICLCHYSVNKMSEKQ